MIYSSTVACYQQVYKLRINHFQILAALSKHVTKYCEENPKKSSSKVYDSVREKVPKSLSDNVYCSVFWYILQDLCARLLGQDAAWLSNAGDLAAVRLEPTLCIEILLQVIPSCETILMNRVEYSSLLQYLVLFLGLDDEQLIPAFVNTLKEETTQLEFYQLMVMVCKKFYTLLPSIDSILTTLTSQLKRLAKKKVSFGNVFIVGLIFRREAFHPG